VFACCYGGNDSDERDETNVNGIEELGGYRNSATDVGACLRHWEHGFLETIERASLTSVVTVIRFLRKTYQSHKW
jgi:hypothetical protein